MTQAQINLKRNIVSSMLAVFGLCAIILLSAAPNAAAGGGDETDVQAAVVEAEAEVAATGVTAGSEVAKFALIAATAAFGLGALAAGYAIAHVGSAAMGAVAEKPEIASQALIFIALAEGLVVFGFITALMILGKM